MTPCRYGRSAIVRRHEAEVPGLHGQTQRCRTQGECAATDPSEKRRQLCRRRRRAARIPVWLAGVVRKHRGAEHSAQPRQVGTPQVTLPPREQVGSSGPTGTAQALRWARGGVECRQVGARSMAGVTAVGPVDRAPDARCFEQMGLPSQTPRQEFDSTNRRIRDAFVRWRGRLRGVLLCRSGVLKAGKQWPSSEAKKSPSSFA